MSADTNACRDCESPRHRRCPPLVRAGLAPVMGRDDRLTGPSWAPRAGPEVRLALAILTDRAAAQEPATTPAGYLRERDLDDLATSTAAGLLLPIGRTP